MSNFVLTRNSQIFQSNLFISLIFKCAVLLIYVLKKNDWVTELVYHHTYIYTSRAVPRIRWGLSADSNNCGVWNTNTECIRRCLRLAKLERGDWVRGVSNYFEYRTVLYSFMSLSFSFARIDLTFSFYRVYKSTRPLSGCPRDAAVHEHAVQ